MINKAQKYSKKIARTLKEEGATSLGIKVLQKIQARNQSRTTKVTKKRQFVSLVDRKEVMKADWVGNPYKSVYKKRQTPATIAWVMSPPANGGGHQNIFRFIDFLDKKGYKNNVYLYSMYDTSTIEDAIRNTKSYSKAKKTSFHYYDAKKSIKSDIIFATGWETAYPVFNQNTDALKFYFVQDFEPLFYPMGTDYVLAENTYKFGFQGITAGGWLAEKLRNDYGMKTTGYNFGADKKLYKVINNKERKDIFFYARPVTERRGFDLGIMALEIFHKKMPEYTIHFAGWDVSEWSIPFPYINHGSVVPVDLNGIYNNCSAALVMSLTNMSLLPLELLSSGVIPIVNEGENNRMVSNNANIRYTESSPNALADELIRAVRENEESQIASNVAMSVDSNGWKKAGETFISILESELRRER